MRVAKAVVLLSLLSVGIYSCRKPYEEEIELREMQTLHGVLRERGDTVWVCDSVLYAPEHDAWGDSLHLNKGDTIYVMYALYGMVGGEQPLLETNIPTIAEEGNLGIGYLEQDTLQYVVGTGKGMVEGLRIALDHFPHLHGRGWIGIPSRLAYGRAGVGIAPPNSALICFIHCVGYSGKAMNQ